MPKHLSSRMRERKPLFGSMVEKTTVPGCLLYRDRAMRRTGPQPLHALTMIDADHLSGPVSTAPTDDYIHALMCGRVIQSSGPLRYAIVDGMNVRDSRVHNYPPRWNAAPSQELLIIRCNHQTGEVSRPIALAPARL